MLAVRQYVTERRAEHGAWWRHANISMCPRTYLTPGIHLAAKRNPRSAGLSIIGQLEINEPPTEVILMIRIAKTPKEKPASAMIAL